MTKANNIKAIKANDTKVMQEFDAREFKKRIKRLKSSGMCRTFDSLYHDYGVAFSDAGTRKSFKARLDMI